MFKIISIFFLTIFMSFSINAQNQTEITSAPVSAEHYAVFDSKGNPADLDRIIERAGLSDAVFLGEQHDDAAAHSLQAEIFRRVQEKYGAERKVTLSLEMFERDVQTVLDEYLADLITEKKFLDDARPWGNYRTDYRPLVEFAKEKHLNVIAANAPRRYVNMVSRGGRTALEKLSPAAKRWLAPLPYAEASNAYAAKFNSLMGATGDAVNPHNSLLDSQSLWDATMADSIAEQLKREKKSLVVNLNGSFHSENRLGIVEHLLKYRPQTKILVVTMLYADDFKNFDQSKMTDLGDFIILTDAKIPRSGK